MPPIGPPPESQPEEDFSDFMPSQSQIDTAIAMYHADYKVPDIRRHFETLGCSAIVVDGLTTRVLELALASLVRTNATEEQILLRLAELGLPQQDILRLLPTVFGGQRAEQERQAANSDGRGLLFGLFAMVGAMFGGLFGFHTVHKGLSTAQHVENMSNHSGRKRKQKRSSFLP